MTSILLFGMYRLGLLSLDALLARGLKIVGMVTKPEPGIEAMPLAVLAGSRGIPLFTPDRPGEAAFLRQVRQLRPDLIVVAGYHKIFPPKLLALPPRGVINLHGSLLPRHRGPVPWKWSILNGEQQSGMTVQLMQAALDRGPLLAQESCDILPEDSAGTLFARLSALAGPLLARTVEDFLNGRLTPTPQDERQATYEGYPTEMDARISWDRNAEQLRNLIRGLSPSPGAWTVHGGVRLRVRQAASGPPLPVCKPGLILHQAGGELLVSTGGGTLVLRDLCVDGEASRMSEYRLQSLGLLPGASFDGVAPSGTLLPLPGPLVS